MAAKGMDLALAITLIVIGILILVGSIGLGGLASIMGIVLIVLGVLMLIDVLPGGTLWGVITLVIGLLLQFGWLPGLGLAVEILEIIAGVVLLVMGVLKLKG